MKSNDNTELAGGSGHLARSKWLIETTGKHSLDGNPCGTRKWVSIAIRRRKKVTIYDALRAVIDRMETDGTELQYITDVQITMSLKREKGKGGAE